MSTYGVYVFSFQNRLQVDEIQKRVEKRNSDQTRFGYQEIRNYFTTTALPRDDNQRFGKLELCLISVSDNTINYLATAKHNGSNAATREFRVRFEDFINLDNLSLQYDHIEPSSVKKELLDFWHNLSSKELNYLPAHLWSQLLSEIIRHRPYVEERLLELHTKRTLADTFFDSQAFSIPAQEKDAVGLSLDIFGNAPKRELIDDWRPRNLRRIEPAPFLVDLPQAVTPEDTIIIHDAQVFGDWSGIEPYCVGAATFKKKDERLTIMNVNRHKVEECLGVDLFYYHHIYRSYTLVQYKCMESSEDDFIYYPYNDKSYHSEIKRMTDFEDLYSKHTPALDFNNYRFNQDLFFFKLCPRISFEPLSAELSDGMYIPLSYWKVLLGSPFARGSRDGTRISKKNLERYMNNSMFVDLVQHGWTGSNLRCTDTLTTVIKEAIQGKISDLIKHCSLAKLG